MRTVSIFCGLLMSMTSFAQQVQEVKFREEAFDNGMNYPQVIISKNKIAESNINAHILENLAEVKASDFCIGLHSYVQKGIHLQIHVYANCIDFDESRNIYFFYNLEKGQAVPHSDLIGEKRKVATGKYLLEEATKHLGDKSSELTDAQKNSILEQNLDAFDVRLVYNGISIQLKDCSAWGDSRLELTWAHLQSYLRLNYI